MAEIIDFKTGERTEEMEKRKPTMKEMEARVQQLETIVGQIQAGIGAINNELFQNNANGIALFRALEDKKILTEEDIKESWQKNVVDPYEAGQEDEDEVVEPTTETSK